MRLAIVDWVSSAGEETVKKRRLWQNANRWLFEDEREIFDEDGVTFHALCRTMGVDSSFVRAQAKLMTKIQVRVSKLHRSTEDQ